MHHRQSWFVLYGVLGLALTVLSLAAWAQSDVPTAIARTNVSLEIKGFAFASGLKRNARGELNGQGTEIVDSRGCGSGFLIRRDGTLVTNYHVIRRAREGRVLVHGGTSYDIVRITAIDPNNDLALLQLRASNAVPIAKLGNSDKVKVTDKVLAVGNSQCQGLAVTDGIINQIIRNERGEMAVFRHSAILTPGNSGGALYKGSEVVGVNFLRSAQEPIYYALPINKVSSLVERQKAPGVALPIVFPDSAQAIVKRFKDLHSAVGHIAPGTSDKPYAKSFRTTLPPLQDVAILLDISGYDLDLLIRDADGNVLGYGANPSRDVEGVFLTTEGPQRVEIIVLNYNSTTVRFGLHLFEIAWWEE